jgi:hypothetical protein
LAAVRDLDLSWNSISATGACELAGVLRGGACPKLQKLNLFWNYIGTYPRLRLFLVISRAFT